MNLPLTAMRGLRNVFGQEAIAIIARCDTRTAHRVLSAFVWSVMLIDTDARAVVVEGACRLVCDELRAARAAARERKDLHS